MITCGIAEDLMPLYADNICTEESRAALDKHMENCVDCRKKLEIMTSELKSNENTQEEIKRAEIFKLLHKKHLQLALTTFIICVVLLVPAVTCGVLYVNDETNMGVSFSTLSADRTVRRIGNLFKSGRSRQALDSMILPDQDSYEYERLGELKDTLAEDITAYFEAHPIEKIRVFSKQTRTGNVETRLLFEMEKQLGCLETPVFFIDFRCYGQELRYERSGVEFGTEYDRRTGYYVTEQLYDTSYDVRRHYYCDMPELKLVGADFSDEYFGKMKYPDEIPQGWFISNKEYGNLIATAGDDWHEECRKHYNKAAALSTKYHFFQCKTGKTEYITDDENGRYYLQHAEVIFYQNGELFWVQLYMPYNLSCYPLMFLPAENITFSDNAPQEFRELFTEIFCK